jgi:hypothetical protein
MTAFFVLNCKICKMNKLNRTVGPPLPGPSRFEVRTAIAKLKTYKSPGSDQIPAELIQAGGETSPSAIHKRINCNWNKEELPYQ